MKDTPKDILGEFRAKDSSAPTIAEKAPWWEMQAYQPYSIVKEAKRHLELRMPFPAPAECPSNATLTNVSSAWRFGTSVRLDYSNSKVIIIEGTNLMELFHSVLNWKVEWIEPFDPRQHFQPTDDKPPFVKSITIHTERPESAPPVAQRH